MRYLKSFINDAAIQDAVNDKSLGKPYVALDENTGKIDWDSKEIDPAKEYLTIKALESGNFYVRKSGIGYSVNGGEWQTTAGSTTLSLTSGDAVRFKGTSNGLGYGLFSGNTQSFKTYGNIESLEYGDDFVGKTNIKSTYDYFRGLYSGCTGLVDASKLIIPATNAVASAYREMFLNCTSLEIGPEILATKLNYLTCVNMFKGCSKLKYIKCLATNMYNSTGNWVEGVASTGTFYKATGVNWPTGISGIPSGWTVIEE